MIKVGMYFEFMPVKFEDIHKSLIQKLSLVKFFVSFIRKLDYF